VNDIQLISTSGAKRKYSCFLPCTAAPIGWQCGHGCFIPYFNRSARSGHWIGTKRYVYKQFCNSAAFVFYDLRV